MARGQITSYESTVTTRSAWFNTIDTPTTGTLVSDVLKPRDPRHSGPPEGPTVATC